MVAIGHVWEGHEVLNEERGMVRHFLARQIGDKRDLVWLHIRDGARFDEAVFAEDIARLQRLSDEVPEIVRVLYGGVSGSVAWAASPVLSDAIPLVDATRENDVGPADLKVLIEIGRCLVRAHELSIIHGALSPDRVLIEGDGRYAITHFGFARLFQLGAEEARNDPYGHAPPELISGGRLGPRADVYGFGTIMYELLCKRALSPWAPQRSFPAGIPPVLQAMIEMALEEDPKRRQPSIEKMLSVLTQVAREWEERGGAPELPHAHIFAEPCGSRRAPDEEAPISIIEDEAERSASGEHERRASELPAPHASDAPDTVKSVMPPRDDIAHASPLATPRPCGAPDTLKSAMPPRDARPNVSHAPPVVSRSPSPELPDLDPMLPVLPAPSTPPRSPVLPVPPALSTPPRSSGSTRSSSLTRLVGSVLALAFLLGSSGAILRWWAQSSRRAAPRLARVVYVVQLTALRASAQPPPSPSDAPQAPPSIEPRPITNRQAVFTQPTVRTPSDHDDICYGLVACGQHKY
ncbi:serine/threonine protein kinase [Sorangium sp. So ce341]|uniref:serine/threonine protein kinase n=1 Tax=Sorangium sp. So ce341 TaxID=3133302 RepID=UPI003F60305D